MGKSKRRIAPNYNRGVIFAIGFCFLSTALWLLAQPSVQYVTRDPILSLARLSGVLGLTLYVFNILLSARLKIYEQLFGAMNNIYRLHHMIGGIAFTFILLHPILIILANWDAPRLLRLYVVPSEASMRAGYVWGVIALWMIVVLLSITYWARIPYQWWKRTHYAMGLAAFFLLLHVWLVPSSVQRSVWLQYWLLTLLLLSIIVRGYKFLWTRYIRRGYRYKVERIEHLGDVTQVTAQPIHRSISYLPGQFAFVTYESKTVPREEHPFSISTYSDRGTLRFSMKNSGDFTAQVHRLKQGDLAYIQGPFGEFGHAVYETTKPIVMVAGGIGITPFLSLLRWLSERDDQRAVSLIYSVKEKSEAVHLPELRKLEKELANFKFELHESNAKGFLTAEMVVGGGGEKSRYLLCGPPGMQAAIRDQLRAKGVANFQIETELFSL